MKLPEDGRLLRIFLGERDKWQGQPLYQAIVLLARKEGLAGATAIKGFMGFGCKSRMHTSKLLELSEDLPIIIEIVDSKEKIEKFIPFLDQMVSEGMVTMEDINVIMYRSGKV
jgi:PII-like signaling protein